MSTVEQVTVLGKYQPYPEYKDSGEWVGLMPSFWEMKALKYLVSCNNEVLSEATEPDYEFEYIDIGGVSASEGITRTETMKFSGSPSRARRIVRQGDIIVSTVRTYLEAIAPISLEHDNKIVSTGFAVLRPKYLLSEFARYALRARYFIDSVVARSTGVSYPAINSSDLINIRVAVPSQQEQRTIAAFLDYETARIDKLISQQQRLIELLKEKRQAVISHAVTKGLYPDAPMKDSGVEWLGKVPEHWDKIPLKTVISLKHGFAFDGNKFSDTGEYIIMTPGNFTEQGGFRPKVPEKYYVGNDFSKEYILSAGQLLVAMTEQAPGLLGSALFVPSKGCYLHNQRLGLVTDVRVNKITEQYLFHLFNSPRYRAEVSVSATGAKVRHSSTEKMLSIKVFLPSIFEQKQIIEYLEDKLTSLERLNEKALLGIVLLQERRAALISAAVTGKIDLRGWTLPGEVTS